MIKNVYLAGAMECYGISNKAKEWRDYAKEFFEKYSNFRAISPTDFYEYGKKYHTNENEVFKFDLHKIKESSVVLVNLANLRKSVGTCDEIMYAYMNNIPVVGFLDIDRNLSTEEIIELVHPWKYLQINRIETGSKAMLNAMNYIMEYYG